jgi:hypothetical protein
MVCLLPFGPERFVFRPAVYECNTVILPVVLYGCETWSFTLREEHRLRVFENRALRRMFGPKKNEVTGEWTTLHSEEFEVSGTCGTHGRRKCKRFWWESQREGDRLKDQGVDGSMTSVWTLGR